MSLRVLIAAISRVVAVFALFGTVWLAAEARWHEALPAFALGFSLLVFAHAADR